MEGLHTLSVIVVGLGVLAKGALIRVVIASESGARSFSVSSSPSKTSEK